MIPKDGVEPLYVCTPPVVTEQQLVQEAFLRQETRRYIAPVQYGSDQVFGEIGLPYHHDSKPRFPRRLIILVTLDLSGKKSR